MGNGGIIFIDKKNNPSHQDLCHAVENKRLQGINRFIIFCYIFFYSTYFYEKSGAYIQMHILCFTH